MMISGRWKTRLAKLLVGVMLVQGLPVWNGGMAAIAAAPDVIDTGSPDGTNVGAPDGAGAGAPDGADAGAPGGSDAGAPGGSDAGAPGGSDAGAPDGSDAGAPSGTDADAPDAGPPAPLYPLPVSGAEGPIGNISDYAWEKAEIKGYAPEKRHAAAMAQDVHAGNVVLFGGKNESKTFQETWIWDGREKKWSEQTNLSTQPSARKSAVMTYDPNSGKVLLFGGEAANGTVLDDTWMWNGIDERWEQVTGLATAPSARAGAYLAYDGSQLVLFGGYAKSGSTKTPLGDTWLWDGTKWTQAAPAVSPSARYDGQMVYDGKTAFLYGGNAGEVPSNHSNQELKYNDSPPEVWTWDKENGTWVQAPGPRDYGRWAHAMAYDGRRVVFFSGERDYISSQASLIEGVRLPNSMYWEMRGAYVNEPDFYRSIMAFGWTGSKWERYPYEEHIYTLTEYLGKPNIMPFPMNYASMAFDGENFILFGGHRDVISVWDDVGQKGNNNSWPAGSTGDTWLFGYRAPFPPSVRFDIPPAVNYVSDEVNVVTNVTSDGNRSIITSGVEYRLSTEAGDGVWTKAPYTGTHGKGSFTVTLAGLEWHKLYEVRGYATNEIDTVHTDIATFMLNDDDALKEPDIYFERVGPSILHIKEKKRLVAVGRDVSNLLRKPLNQIRYVLEGPDGTEYPLAYNVLNDRQLELTWEDDLDPGTYSVNLVHDFYDDYEFPDALWLSDLSFYKPRNYASVEVISTSVDKNEVGRLVLQGPFTEEPTAPNVYKLNDPAEVVTINDSVLFKGTELTVDKSAADGTATIQGNGRLYVNSKGATGSGMSYILHEGPFTISSGDFSFAANAGVASDYLGMDMPIRVSGMTFTDKGLRLSGDVELSVKSGNFRARQTVEVDDVIYRNQRFDMTGTFEMDALKQFGPLRVDDARMTVDSRIPHVGIQGKGSLPNTDVGFDLHMYTKHGEVDSFQFAMYGKSAKLGSTGLRVDYLFGSGSNLAGKQVPQTIKATGSITDVIVPAKRHPQASYSFNLIGTDSINAEITPYGLNASGTEYYYWLPINNMTMQAIVNPSAAKVNGFTTQGFRTNGNINVFDVVKGAFGAYNMSGKGFGGIVKGTVYVPKGIPRIGGATVRDVTLSVTDSGIIGVFQHNGVGSRVSYTFSNNTILFEVEAEPPKKKWWEKGLDFINGINDFMEKIEPWGELAEEILLSNRAPDKARMVQILSSGRLKTVYEMKTIGISFQPEDMSRTDVSARLVDGSLTAIRLELPLATSAASGQWTAAFETDYAHDALLVLTGDRRSAALQGQETKKGTGSTTEVYYDESGGKTYVRARLTPGRWTLTTNEVSELQVYELAFANQSLSLEELAAQWSQAADRSVTTLYVEERGTYVLRIEDAPEQVIVYKPDGRPYDVQTSESEPGWNAFRDASGDLHVLVSAVEPGTWVISAGVSPAAELSSVSAATDIAAVQEWIQTGTYVSTFDMKDTRNGQAIVELYGADEGTELKTPKGTPYALQTNPNRAGMNAIYDESSRKLTVWLNTPELAGQWTVESGGFVSSISYESSRKFNSIKPLLTDGRFTKRFELGQAGDYMLTISGGGEDTVVKGPDGSVYELDFTVPNGNAYVQPASDRMAPAAGGSSDPVDVTQIVTPNPATDGKDTLYVSLLDAKAGRWSIQTSHKAELQIQKLIPLPEITASVNTLSAAGNEIEVAWSMDHAQANTEVAVMLTASADELLGERIAEGLPSSGHETIVIPAGTLPGTYYVTVMATSEGEAPVYTVAEQTVTVTAPVSLPAPGSPEVVSTGNGEVTLKFASSTGDVAAYRVWIGDGSSGVTNMPAGDYAPEAGSTQTIIVAGLALDEAYDFAVSAIGEDGGRLAVSPLSAAVTATLPVPNPALVTVTLDAGAEAAVEQPYTAYDGTQETLLATAAKQASIVVGSDQNAAVTLSIHGEQIGEGQVAAGGTFAFALHELLDVAELKERDYNIRIDAVNEQGDRSVAYRKLFVDRTGPMLIVSGGDDAEGRPIALNGTVTSDSKLYITGQTDAGAALVVNGTNVPLDDDGRFVYYAPIDWDSQPDPDRYKVTVTASDAVGNVTEYRFEAIQDMSDDPTPDYKADLAALTVTGARMSAPYTFGTTSYQAAAYADKVRVYAVPMSGDADVKIGAQKVGESGYVEVSVPAEGRTLTIVVTAGSTTKQYTIQLLASGSSVAALQTLKLHEGTKKIAAAPFTGMEESYAVFVANETESITLTPEAVMEGSAIILNDGITVQDGQATQPISLMPGDNELLVKVTSPDGSASREYRVNVFRALSDNALLQGLGVTTVGAELIGGFQSEVSQHQVLVPHGTNELTLLPVAEHTSAAVRVNGLAIDHAAQMIPFAGEVQHIAIEVTAEDGTQRTYSLSALRRQATPERPPLLASLQTAGAIIEGDFDPYQYRYGTIRSTESTSIGITAIPHDPSAVVTVGNVAHEGGGKFNSSLKLGDNTIYIRVESADKRLSQTYSIDVRRVEPENRNVRRTTATGDVAGWRAEVPITRSEEADGRAVDSVSLYGPSARVILGMAKQKQDSTIRIYVDDLPEAPADEQIASFDAEFISVMAEGGVSLVLTLPNAQIKISSETLRQLHDAGEDAYFRVVPVRAEVEREEVESRVQDAEPVRQAASGGPVTIIGQPMKIETNYTGFKTELLLPLDGLTIPEDPDQTASLADTLYIYIEHSDGEKVLRQGELRYDESGKLLGIAIEIEKFSVFTVIHAAGDMLHETFDSYLSGYPDGTFRPSKSITRAEMANILHRAALEDEQAAERLGAAAASGYPDVKKAHWAADAIAAVRLEGWMTGGPDGRFRPDDAVSRAEMAAIVARLLPAGTIDGSVSESYRDTEGHWATKEIQAASQAGIFKGYPDDTFRPEVKLSRAEAVAVLNRLFGRPSIDVRTSGWPDVPNDHWALQEIVSASRTLIRFEGGSVVIEPKQ